MHALQRRPRRAAPATGHARRCDANARMPPLLLTGPATNTTSNGGEPGVDRRRLELAVVDDREAPDAGTAGRTIGQIERLAVRTELDVDQELVGGGEGRHHLAVVGSKRTSPAPRRRRGGSRTRGGRRRCTTSLTLPPRSTSVTKKPSARERRRIDALRSRRRRSRLNSPTSRQDDLAQSSDRARGPADSANGFVPVSVDRRRPTASVVTSITAIRLRSLGRKKFRRSRRCKRRRRAGRRSRPPGPSPGRPSPSASGREVDLRRARSRRNRGRSSGRRSERRALSSASRRPCRARRSAMSCGFEPLSTEHCQRVGVAGGADRSPGCCRRRGGSPRRRARRGAAPPRRCGCARRSVATASGCSTGKTANEPVWKSVVTTNALVPLERRRRRRRRAVLDRRPSCNSRRATARARTTHARRAQPRARLRARAALPASTAAQSRRTRAPGSG